MKHVVKCKLVFLDNIFKIKEKARHEHNNCDIQKNSKPMYLQIRIDFNQAICHKPKCLKNDNDGQVFVDQRFIVLFIFPINGRYTDKTKGCSDE